MSRIDIRLWDKSLFGDDNMSTRIKLAETAKEKARLPFHGFLQDKESNIKPIVSLFPKWNIQDADRMWCSGFVYYCCVEAGFKIPYSPDECISCSLADVAVGRSFLWETIELSIIHEMIAILRLQLVILFFMTESLLIVNMTISELY